MRAYDELRRQHVADMLSAMPEYVARLSWDRRRLETFRRRALRLLLRVAQEHSPWYRERLREIDPAVATELDLERIPPMTRADLMDHWDEIVVYPGFDLAGVQAHLEEVKDDAYLGHAFHAVASSGASGRRGVFLYDWESWIASFAGSARWRLRRGPRQPEGPAPSIALLGAERASHVGYALNQTFSRGEFAAFPARLPLPEIVRGLNAARPDVLIGYPSALRALVEQTRSGALRISPAYVHSTGEPLSRALEQDLSTTWGARIGEGWGASEAPPLAQGCGTAPGMHVSDDLVILEPVDAQGGRVAPGCRSDKLYLTNLFNLALPLIRYELTDQVTLSCESCPCGSAYTRIDRVLGRLDERFVYDDGVIVEPESLESVLSREPSVYEYQVLQTDTGAEVRVRCDRKLHLRAVGQRVASALGKRGVRSPAVSVRRVDSIERASDGKLPRFVPRSVVPDPYSQGGVS